MSDPKPLRLEQDDELGRLIAEARAVRRWTGEDARTQRERVEEQALFARSWQLPQWALAPVAVAASLALGVLLARLPDRGADWLRLALDPSTQGVAEVSPGTNVTQPRGEPQKLTVAEGKLRATRIQRSDGQAFTVETPHLRVAGQRVSFRVDVTALATLVAVSEGEVDVVGLAGKSARVVAGGEITSQDERLLAAAPRTAAPDSAVAPAPTPIAVSRCGREEGVEARRRCYLGFTDADGLSAENSLYALGKLEQEAGRGAQALEYWRMYQRRFPEGALGPEVGIAMMQQQIAQERTEDALASAESFEKRYPGDPRLPEVALSRANLLCSTKPEAAAAVYERLVESASAPAREEALFAFASCEAARGAHPHARELLRRYLREFPGGRHVAEAKGLLSP